MELLTLKYKVEDARAFKRLDFFNLLKSKSMRFPMPHVAHVFVCVECVRVYLCLLALLHTVMHRSGTEQEYSAMQQLIQNIKMLF